MAPSNDNENQSRTKQLDLNLSTQQPSKTGGSVVGLTTSEKRNVRAEAIQHVIRSGIFEPPKTKLV